MVFNSALLSMKTQEQSRSTSLCTWILPSLTGLNHLACAIEVAEGPGHHLAPTNRSVATEINYVGGAEIACQAP